MKDTPLSNCEREFILQCTRENRRLDGRKLQEFRPLKINFGSEWGSVHVSLGETRVLAQVTCELGQPKATRPNEGLLYINVDLSPMAAINFEAGRNSELTVLLNRTLERTYKDSRCVDLESLCVTAEDKVWILRVNVVILNHEGNLIDCAAIAALSSLAHFKHPDVTVSGDEFKVHTPAEKDPIPIVLHHFPVCVSYATFPDIELAVADPTLIEEKVSGTSMVFGINSYRELCSLNLGGTTLTSTNLLLKTSNHAAERAKIVVDQIKAALEEDAEARSQGKSVGFTECLRLQKITSLTEDKLVLKLPHFQIDKPFDIKMDIVKEEEMEEDEMTVKKIDKNTAMLKSNMENVRWIAEEEDDSSSFDNGSRSDNEENLEHELQDIVDTIKITGNQATSSHVNSSSLKIPKKEPDSTSSESEEDETMEL